MMEVVSSHAFDSLSLSFDFFLDFFDLCLSPSPPSSSGYDLRMSLKTFSSVDSVEAQLYRSSSFLRPPLLFRRNI